MPHPCFPAVRSREAFLFFSCPLCSVHVYLLSLRLSHFHFLNPFFPRSDRYIPVPPQGHAAGSAVVGELATVGEEKYAGEDEGRCKAGVENRNESLGQPPEAPDRNTERNHKGHHQPAFRIEERKRTARGLLTMDAARVLTVQTQEYQREEEGENGRSLGDAEEGVAGHLAPGNQPDAQDVGAGGDPHRAGRCDQEFPIDVKFHQHVRPVAKIIKTDAKTMRRIRNRLPFVLSRGHWKPVGVICLWMLRAVVM
jgi:hypothetical protein